MLAHLCVQAQARGITRLRGLYLPTKKNALVKDLYEQMGFEPAGGHEGGSVWEYDLATRGPIQNTFVGQD